jgi:hypothetical protein
LPPRFWLAGHDPLGGGLLWYPPMTGFGHGDNPGFVEYHSHGVQVLAGNLYVTIGCVLLAIMLIAAVRGAGRPARPSGGPATLWA